ncbi:MAG: sugar ABC transporter permease [Tissierellia bacterium]|nr:sugar ABC transporter permease [Tissierellia bacterium]
MKIKRFLERKTAYLFILPALILIILFSIWPIVASLRYAFFDLQLNDQARSDLYTEASYNLRLHNETIDYIRYYLNIDESVVQTDEAHQAIAELRQQVDAFDEYVETNVVQGLEPVVSIDQEKETEITRHKNEIIAGLESFYTLEDEFYSPEDMMAVVGEFNTSLIQSNYMGLENFERVMTDHRVRSTLTFTLIFTFVSVFFELILGLALALIMNKAMAGRGLIRTVSLIPWAIPTSVAAMMWSYLYDGSSGIVANLFANIGIVEQSTDLLLQSSKALLAIIIADVWKTTPYMALLLLAGLQTIPNSLYESSSLEGANRWHQFRYITLPLLKTSIFVALLFRTLDAFRVFDLIYVLTGGGPGGTTESISIYAYKVMFAQTRFGYGAAIVLIMALAVGLITWLYVKSLNVKLIED